MRVSPDKIAQFTLGVGYGAVSKGGRQEERGQNAQGALSAGPG
jgi:hypothetical protein